MSEIVICAAPFTGLLAASLGAAWVRGRYGLAASVAAGFLIGALAWLSVAGFMMEYYLR